MMLQDQFDALYSSLKKRNKLQAILRFSIRNLANFILPVYFKLTASNLRKPIRTSEEMVIVSITTFPQRISKLWLVIECMFRQTYLPDRIVLWLSKEQFPNQQDDLPKRLRRYQKSGKVDIVFVDGDLRSHKKYFYAFQKYQNDIIITVDDDLFYSSNTIKDLIDLHSTYPNEICCLRGFRVERDEHGGIKQYTSWKKLNGFQQPSFNIFHTSGGGTLYKNTFFNSEVLNKDVFKEKCFHADDVWLNIMAQMNNTKTVKSEFYSHLIPIQSNSIKLSRQNVEEGGNDKQLTAVLEHYKIKANEIFK